MKRIILLLLCIMSFMTSAAYADSIGVSIDGSPVSFSDASPQIVNSRTMVPVRSIFESLGASVQWDANTKQITGTKGSTTVVMTLNSNYMSVNGYIRKMDVAPTVISSRTFTPVKYVAESLGYSVEWINNTRQIKINSDNFTKVHFVDVGQGDCEIVTDNDHTMVIDAGEEGNEDTVVNYLKSLNVSSIDYVIATHPHSDHIGSLDGVINSFDVKNVIMPNVAHTSYSYQNLITAIGNSGANVIEAKAGSSYTLGNSEFSILGPVNYDEDELNNCSAVIKLTSGSESVLFTGDAEAAEESDILSTGASVASQTMKIGHHGSSSSTSASFFNAVNPDITVICVGASNSYGHPTQQTLNTIKDTEIYRTDINGNIILNITDNSIFALTQKIGTVTNNTSTSSQQSQSSTPKSQSSSSSTNAADNVQSTDTYVLNTNSKKVHKPSCASVSKISDQNKQSYSGSISSLTSQGYTACKNCKPF